MSEQYYQPGTPEHAEAIEDTLKRLRIALTANQFNICWHRGGPTKYHAETLIITMPTEAEIPKAKG